LQYCNDTVLAITSQAPKKRAEVPVQAPGQSDGVNPRCSCGSAMKKKYPSPVFRYLDFLRVEDEVLSDNFLSPEGRIDDGRTLRGFSACVRWLRVRTGAARTFGPLFVVFSALMLALGAVFLYDPCTHPMTADAGQVLIGSVGRAFCLLAVSSWFGRAASYKRA
jgi:hypothetical protein